MRNINKKGFTLLEVIGAILIFSIGILAAYRVIPSVISGVALNSSKATAAYLTQEGMEIIRNIRDGNWLEMNNGVIGAVWNEQLVPPDIDCSAGCETDYRILGSQDPALTSYGSGRYLNIDSNGFYSYSAGTASKFKRKIKITPGSGGQIVYENNTQDDDIDNLCGSDAWKAQTFTPQISHNINSVKLKLTRGPDPYGDAAGCTFTASIRATDGFGLPTGGDLTSATLPCSSVLPDNSWASNIYTFNFGVGYNLSAGVKYAIIMRTNGGTGCPQNYKLYYGFHTANPYPGGLVYQSSNGGVNWVSVPSTSDLWDAYFQETGAGVNLTLSVDVYWQEKGKSYKFSAQEKLYQY
jgi:prepilin-type N-terminal cleavage/methylation domain-containing protein